jgi:hypothetical protein
MGTAALRSTTGSMAENSRPSRRPACNPTSSVPARSNNAGAKTLKPRAVDADALGQTPHPYK